MKPKLPYLATILLALTTIALLAIPVLFDQQTNNTQRHINTLQQNIHHLQHGIYQTETLYIRAQETHQNAQLLKMLNASPQILNTQTQATQDLIHQATLSAIQTAAPNRQEALATALLNLNTYAEFKEVCDRYLSEAQNQVLHVQNQITEFNKTLITLNTRRTHWLIGCVAFQTIGLALALLSAYWT